MDDLTRERYDFAVPWRELHTRPSPPPKVRPRYDDPPDVIAERVRILCDDLPTWVIAQRRLARALVDARTHRARRVA